MNHSYQYRRPLALASALALLLLLPGCGRGKGVAVRAGQAPQVDAAGKGPHTTAAVLDRKEKPLAESGWLELFFDDEAKGVSIRSHKEAEWSVLARAGSAQRSNAGACAVEADIYVNGHKITLNSQDHSVAYGNAVSKNVKGGDGKIAGVEVAYTLTPDAATAGRAAKNALKPDDTAFLVRVRYTLEEGNFLVDADWESLNGNPNAFLAELGLLERFGALRNPGPNDFFLLPDGCGALLYPGRAPAAGLKDLRFAVYGSDPSAPGGAALRANVAAWGVRGQGAGFVAVVDRGAALCDIVARQSVPAVGPHFTVTPVAVDANGLAITRAPESYGGAPGESFSVTYRFFNGDSARFSTMATACREQLISNGALSSTKAVRDDTGLLPLELTLLGTGPARLGQRTLTTFKQALDILTRLKNQGVNSMNVRYQGALGWLQKPAGRVSPLLRLGGARDLGPLQDYCKFKGLTLFPDAQLYPAGGAGAPAAETLTGEKLRVPPPAAGKGSGKKTIPLRAASGFTKAARALLVRLGRLDRLKIAGLALGDAGRTLYADYSGRGFTRMQTAESLDQLLPAFSAQWALMLDTGDFHAVRHADVIVNLPLEPQVQMPGGRYVPVPLLPILLHSSADYSGAPLNLSGDPDTALLRAISYGACPAFTFAADDDGDALFFEAPSRFNSKLKLQSQLDDALHAYNRANAALAGLRDARITEYTLDPVSGLHITGYSNGAVVYVNFGNTEKIKDEITVPPMDFVRIG